MSDKRKLDGEYPTYTVLRSWIAMDLNGQKALLFETKEGGVLAFRLPDGAVPILQAKLAELRVPSSKPGSA